MIRRNRPLHRHSRFSCCGGVRRTTGTGRSTRNIKLPPLLSEEYMANRDELLVLAAQIVSAHVAFSSSAPAAGSRQSVGAAAGEQPRKSARRAFTPKRQLGGPT
jgi:hypothetical protein